MDDFTGGFTDTIYTYTYIHALESQHLNPVPFYLDPVAMGSSHNNNNNIILPCINALSIFILITQNHASFSLSNLPKGTNFCFVNLCLCLFLHKKYDTFMMGWYISENLDIFFLYLWFLGCWDCDTLVRELWALYSFLFFLVVGRWITHTHTHIGDQEEGWGWV